MLARDRRTGAGIAPPGRFGRPRAYHPDMPGVWNIAHRGASHDRPENTLAAFEEAIRQGADAVEADVRMTADGELLVINDARLDRTTDGSGEVRAIDYARARRLDAGRGERIPTPVEVLEVARGRARVTFDIKEPDSVDALVAMVRELEMAGSVTYLTYLPDAAEHLRELGVTSPVVQAVDSAAAAASLVTGHTEAGRALAGIGLPAALVSPALVDMVRRRGFGAFVWTVDDPDEMARLVDSGVNGIVTNRPSILAGVLRDRGATRT
jgi:glycerophosphoryl diester phosphodiesterase